jgi:hypothetical protein
MEYLTRKDKYTFKRNLIADLLFQPKIVIPDIFIYISKGVETAILGSETESLVEMGIREGIIVPAFRKRAQSFKENLWHIQGEGDPKRAIHGVRPNAADVASRLDRARRGARHFSPMIWPTRPDMGESFAMMIDKHLSSKEPPRILRTTTDNPGKMKTYWEMTGSWRRDCVEEAVSKTRETEGRGLRRGDLMDAIGRDLGFPEGHQVHDVEQLIRRASPKQRPALESFLSWMNILYHYNQTCALNGKYHLSLSVGSPCYTPIRGAMINEILPSELDFDLSKYPIFEDLVSIPSLRSLENVSPGDLIKARLQRSSYFAKLEEWQTNPTSENEQNLKVSLHSYAKALDHLAEGTSGGYLLHVLFGSLSSPSRDLLIAVLALVYGYLAKEEPSAIPLVALGSVGWGAFRWVRERPKKVAVRIASTVPTDVNFRSSA